MRGMSWVAGVICVLGWTMVGSAQIPGYTISPTNIQLSSLADAAAGGHCPAE